MAGLIPRSDTPAALRASPIGITLVVMLLCGQGIEFGIVNPGQNWQLDFRSFYTVGTAVLQGMNPYDRPALDEAIASKLPGDQPLVGYAYPPPTLPLMAAFAHLPLEQAQIAWAWFQFGLLLLGMLLLFRALQVPLGSPAGVLITATFWLSAPVKAVFVWGQFDGIRVALLGAAVYCLLRSRPGQAGVSIALAALAKVYPAAYFVVFVLRRQWRALIAGLLVLVILMGVGTAMLSPAARASYFGNNQNEFSGVDMVIAPGNMSLIGFLHRAFVDNPDGWQASRAWIDLGAETTRIVCAVAIVTVLALTAGWMLLCRRSLTPAENIAGLVPAVVLVELNAWPHHCVPMLIPIAFITVIVARQRQPHLLDLAWLTAILGLYTFSPVRQFDVGLPDWLSHLVGPTTTYAMMLAWLFMLTRYAALKRTATPMTSGS